MKFKNGKKINKLTAVIIFFVFMFLLTLICRFIDSYRVPRVSVYKPQPGRISIEHFSKGSITASEFSYFPIKAGLYVSQVFTAVGKEVEKGDNLYSFPLEEIEQALLQKQIEWNELKIEQALLQKELKEDKIEDLEMKTKKKHEKEIIDLKIQNAEKEIEELKNLKLSNGIVTAPISGIVLDIPVTVLERTESGNYVRIGNGLYVSIAPETWLDTWKPFDGTETFVAILESDETKDKNTNQSNSKEEEWNNLITENQKETSDIWSKRLNFNIIASIEMDKDKNGYFINLPEGTYPYGEDVIFRWKEQTKEYPLILPSETLIQDWMGNYCVYRIRKKTDILGEKEYAELVSVEIEAQGNGYVAVNGALSEEDFIILPGDEEIIDGGRVRMAE